MKLWERENDSEVTGMENAEKSQNQNQNSKDHSNIRVLMDTSNAKIYPDTSTKPEKDWYSKLTKTILPQIKWNEIFNMLTVLIAALVLTVYWKQLQVMSGQLQEIRGGSIQTNALIVIAANQAKTAKDALESSVESFKKTLKQMEAQTRAQAKSADGALAQAANFEKSLRATIDNFHLDQRAWIGVTTFKISQYPPNPFQADINFVNSGKTPAIHMNHAQALTIYPGFIAGPTPSQIPQYTFVEGGATAPQGIGIITMDDKSSLQNITSVVTSRDVELRSKSAFLYIHGEITYDDIFGGHHHTIFCFYMYDQSTHQLGYCKEHNNID